jgi:hypothetical protein
MLLQRIVHLVELTPQALPVFDGVDEASMVDLAAAYALARRLFPDARLLLEQEDEAQFHRSVLALSFTVRWMTRNRTRSEQGHLAGDLAGVDVRLYPAAPPTGKMWRPRLRESPRRRSSRMQQLPITGSHPLPAHRHEP